MRYRTDSAGNSLEPVVLVSLGLRPFDPASVQRLKQKPRVGEEHDSYYGIISAVEAGTGVAIGADVLGHTFGNRVKLLSITPEPKPISVGIVALKGPLSPAAGKFWEYAKEAAAKK